MYRLGGSCEPVRLSQRGMAMIGYIHRLLFALIESTGGVEALVEIKLHAGVPEDRYFAMNRVYSDEEWQRLLGATCEVLGLPRTKPKRPSRTTSARRPW